jgi:hypothetical protein
MEELYAARYNIFWYLSLFVPAAIMIISTFWHKKSILIVGIFVSLISTYMLCNLSVQKKWDVRNEIAKTEKERAYAQADGANLVFTAIIIGPLESVLYTIIWGLLGWKMWPKYRKHKNLFQKINQSD